MQTEAGQGLNKMRTIVKLSFADLLNLAYIFDFRRFNGNKAGNKNAGQP